MWSIVTYILVFTVIENVISSVSEEDQAMKDVPLSRSLGYTVNKNIGKTLENPRIGEAYIPLYNEILRASQETIAKFGDRNAYAHGTDVTRLQGIADHRRSSRINSPVRQRRARSQALRREKLNNQSLRSHLEHSRLSSLEQRMI